VVPVARPVAPAPRTQQMTPTPPLPDQPVIPPERSSRRRRSSGNATAWIVGAVVAASLLVLGGGALGLYLFLDSGPVPRGPSKGTPTVADASEAQPLPSPPTGKEPAPKEPPEKEPPAEPPLQLPQTPPPGSEPAPPEVPALKTAPIDFQLGGKVLKMINDQRAAAGVPPLKVDEKQSTNCYNHADYLLINTHILAEQELDHHDEELVLSGATPDAKKLAPKTTVVREEPMKALQAWLDAPASRGLILRPDLKSVAFGFSRSEKDQWVSVFDWDSGVEPAKPSPQAPYPILYPVDQQAGVPLTFPGDEIPNPIPQDKDLRAGYPITVTFPPRARLSEGKAWLEDETGKDIPVWFSTPAKPANPNQADHQGTTLCLIARDPLREDTRYAVKVECKVNGRAWKNAWTFHTVTYKQLRQEVAKPALDMFNKARASAGLKPLILDPKRTRTCMAHARYLSQHLRPDQPINIREEKPDLAGYTQEGADIARSAFMLSQGEPDFLANVLLDTAHNRYFILNPELEHIGLGFAPSNPWGWIWVVDMGSPRSIPQLVFQPAPDQENVPLIYPIQENPNPIPKEAAGQLVGYPITVGLPLSQRVENAEASLRDEKNQEVECWLFTPEKPAIKGRTQPYLFLLPKKALTPATRYTVQMNARIDGKPWERTWSFRTVDADAERKSIEEALVKKVNAYRARARLDPVTLDPDLSRNCALHARYLEMNWGNPALKGLNVHEEDPKLPGYTREGARTAQGSVITGAGLPINSVDGWMSTFYHRVPILEPQLERIGFAYTKVPKTLAWLTVMDVLNGRSRR
jgi:uncharacterized protein YkwD